MAPDALTIDSRPLTRPDPATGELAGILHQHLIGELVVHPGADEDVWRLFLTLLTSSPDHLRSQGGIARVWATTGGRSIDIRELDYAEILREKDTGPIATWDRIIANGLRRDVIELDDDTLRELAEMAADAERLAEMTRRVEGQVTRPGEMHAHATVLRRVLSRILDFVTERDPERLRVILDNIARALCGLSDTFLSALIAPPAGGAQPAAGSDFVRDIAGRMDPGMIAGLTARSVVAHRGATARLADVLRTLVPEPEARQTVLSLARADLDQHPLSAVPGFEEIWTRVSELLASDSDDAFHSHSYDHELTSVHAQAAEMGQIADDPPERVAAWLKTVGDSVLRSLDVQLLIDMLQVETEPERWREVARLAIAHLNDLVLVGDFGSARLLLEALRAQKASAQDQYRESWVIGSIDTLVADQLLGHLRTHLQTITNDEFEEVARLGRAVGPSLIAPLAEAIASETRPRVRQRLTEMLLGYGAEGRSSVDHLMHSSNAGVRRTAVQLLRQFGGSDAVPSLAALLDDDEVHVRREAVRAILMLGSDRGYAVLESALVSDNLRARDAVMHELTTLRDGRATPLFCYIIDHTDHRGATADLYLTAIARLGSLGGPAAIDALKSVLYRGEWWAPRRTARLREAAASALAKIGSPEARGVLGEAAAGGPRGVRAAARKATA